MGRTTIKYVALLSGFRPGNTLACVCLEAQVLGFRVEFKIVPNNVNFYIFYWLKAPFFYALWNVLLHKPLLSLNYQAWVSIRAIEPVVSGHVGFSWMEV